MNKKFFIIGVAILFICIGLSGCEQISIGKKSISVTIDKPYMDNTFHVLVLNVTLRGEKSIYHLVLSDSDGSTIGANVVQEIDMADGIQPTQISMGNSFYQTGSKRTYTLIILDGSQNEVNRTSLSYYGANISIINCSAPVWNYNDMYKQYGLENVFVTIENHGDLPAYFGDLGDVEITIRSVKYTPYAFAMRNIEVVPGVQIKSPAMPESNSGIISPGESKAYYLSVESWNPQLDAGETQMTINIVPAHVTFSSTVEIK
jgi:hypothetical protein